MELPKLEKSEFTIKVDTAELTLSEPTLREIEKLASYKDIKEDDSDIIEKLSEVVASLMGSYNGTIEEKREFVKGMSMRQIGLVVDGLMNSVKSKKATAESEKSNS